MCPDDFMGEFIFDEEGGLTCNEMDSFIAMGILDCESEEELFAIFFLALMCCENMEMESCNIYYLFNRSKRKLINDIFSLIVFCTYHDPSKVFLE